MVLKSSATPAVRGQRRENVRGKWEDVGTRGLIPSPPRGASPSSWGLWGQEVPERVEEGR